MAGSIDVLNTSKGHLTISVPDNATPADKAKYERMINDMLQRGYLLFAEKNGTQVKINSYDNRTGEYLLVDTPDAHAMAAAAAGTPAPNPPKAKAGKKKPPRVPASQTNVTGIAPSAGG